eukprot:sb/3472851/
MTLHNWVSYFIAGGKEDASSTRTVGICDPSSSFNPVIVWNFDSSDSVLKITIPGGGMPYFLSLTTGSASLATTSDYNSVVYIEQVPTNSGVDLQAVEDGIEKIKTDFMNWNKDKDINITEAKNKATKSQATATRLLTYYETQLREIGTMVNESTLQAESM